MPQAVTTLLAVTLLALASMTQRGEAPAALGSLAQARRLIEAKDYGAAVTVLEDLLIEAEPTERPGISSLLRAAYEVLARQAQDAGRDRDAAHYRDNIAILEAPRMNDTPAKPAQSKPAPPEGALPSRASDKSDASETDVARPGQPKPSVIPTKRAPAPEPVAEPAALAEPTPLSEPATGAAPETPRRRPSPPVSKISIPTESIETPRATSPQPSAIEPPADPAAMTAQPETRPPTTGTIAGANRPDATRQPSPSATVEQADRFWAAKKYSEAGRVYGELARANHLPAERADQWAYCRMVDVATRINSRPRNKQEWDEIDAEIQGIQRLAPKLWYGEYLRKFVAESRRAQGQSQARAGKLVVRGSTPDESQAQAPQRRLPRLFGKSRAKAPVQVPVQADSEVAPVSTLPDSGGDDGAQPAIVAGADARAKDAVPQSVDRNEPETAGPAPTRARRDSEVRRASGDPTGNAPASWQVIETANFRVFHCNARLAEQAAQAAERVRVEQCKRWGSPALQSPWSPRCDLYLYPNGRALAQATGQPETAPGFSDLFTDGSRVTTRRTVLRTDQPQWLSAVLPHEISHVVLADLFVAQRIPRWADEGIAVLAEPDAEQSLRAADLRESLEAGRLIDLAKLMSNDQPADKDWSVYYAQSVSLTRFLVELDSPQRFIEFVRKSNGKGIGAALSEVYRMGSLDDLQERWLTYARQQDSTNEQARRDQGSQPSVTGVESADGLNQ